MALDNIELWLTSRGMRASAIPWRIYTNYTVESRSRRASFRFDCYGRAIALRDLESRGAGIVFAFRDVSRRTYVDTREAWSGVVGRVLAARSSPKFRDFTAREVEATS